MALTFTISALTNAGFDSKFLFPGSLASAAYSLSDPTKQGYYDLNAGQAYEITFVGHDFVKEPNWYDTEGIISSATVRNNGADIGSLTIVDPNFPEGSQQRMYSARSLTLDVLMSTFPDTLDPPVAVFVGAGGADILRGSSFVDTLNGNGGADVLLGNAGNDLMNGGLGTDRMLGGAGNDTYSVDTLADIVDEGEFEANGTDTVVASLNYSLANANVRGAVENLILGGSALNGTGNGLANVIRGTAAANRLDGGAGADKLNGNGGTDVLVGGDGHDTFYAFTEATQAIETNAMAATGGTDTVLFYAPSGTFRLGANVENLTITSTAAVNGVGNALANTMVGNGLANILVGKTGLDRLTGGGGVDVFLFDTAPGAANVDTVTDMTPVDFIRLSKTVFAAIGPSFTSNEFRANTTGLAGDADDRIIYETDTGRLFYDNNGSVGGGAVQVAILTSKPAIGFADFQFA